MNWKINEKLIRIIISLLLVVISFFLKFDAKILNNLFYLLAYIIVGYDIILKAVRNILKGKVQPSFYTTMKILRGLGAEIEVKFA